jgi:hypothetical protein
MERGISLVNGIFFRNIRDNARRGIIGIKRLLR